MTTNFLEDQATLAKFELLSTEQKNMVKELIEFLYQKTENKLNNTSSFLEEAAEFIGCVDDGPGDLSTNKKYLEGLGKE